jgi:hypothetical protein
MPALVNVDEQRKRMIEKFTPPGPQERLDAIGATSRLSEPLRRALEPHEGFAPMPAPGPDDWLSSHPEEGQSFEAFVRSRLIGRMRIAARSTSSR